MAINDDNMTSIRPVRSRHVHPGGRKITRWRVQLASITAATALSATIAGAGTASAAIDVITTTTDGPYCAVHYSGQERAATAGYVLDGDNNLAPIAQPVRPLIALFYSGFLELIGRSDGGAEERKKLDDTVMEYWNATAHGNAHAAEVAKEHAAQQLRDMTSAWVHSGTDSLHIPGAIADLIAAGMSKLFSSLPDYVLATNYRQYGPVRQHGIEITDVIFTTKDVTDHAASSPVRFVPALNTPAIDGKKLAVADAQITSYDPKYLSPVGKDAEKTVDWDQFTSQLVGAATGPEGGVAAVGATALDSLGVAGEINDKVRQMLSPYKEQYLTDMTNKKSQLRRVTKELSGVDAARWRAMNMANIEAAQQCRQFLQAEHDKGNDTVNPGGPIRWTPTTPVLSLLKNYATVPNIVELLVVVVGLAMMLSLVTRRLRRRRRGGEQQATGKTSGKTSGKTTGEATGEAVEE